MLVVGGPQARASGTSATRLRARPPAATSAAASAARSSPVAATIEDAEVSASVSVTARPNQVSSDGARSVMASTMACRAPCPTAWPDSNTVPDGATTDSR